MQSMTTTTGADHSDRPAQSVQEPAAATGDTGHRPWCVQHEQDSDHCVGAPLDVYDDLALWLIAGKGEQPKVVIAGWGGGEPWTLEEAMGVVQALTDTVRTALTDRV